MNKVEAAREWICSHNDGDVLYVKDAFVSGVDWTIDKACEWLRDNTMADLNLDFGNSQLVREFVDHFKEAMEG